jgi:hypothetical protein
MMKTGWGVMVIAGALTLAGCGGGGSPKPMRAADVARSAGCYGYKAETTQMFTQETGSCQINGTDIYVMTFRTTSARDQWMKVGDSMGGMGFFGEGDLWVLQGDDHDAVAKGTKAAGGKMA